MTDTTDPIAAEPTAEEMAAAQAVLARMQASQAAKTAAVAPKMKGLIEIDGFDAVLAKAAELREEIGAGQPFYDHLNAIVIGMTNAKVDIASVVPAPAA